MNMVREGDKGDNDDNKVEDDCMFSDAISTEYGEDVKDDEDEENDDGNEESAKKRRFNTSKDERQCSEAASDSGASDSGSEMQKLRDDIKNMKMKMKTMMDEVEKMSRVMEKLEAQEQKLLNVGEEVKAVEQVVRTVDIEVKTAVREIDDDLKKVETEFKEIRDQSKDVKDVKKKVDSFDDRMRTVEEKCIDLEGRGRRKNSIFHGVAEIEGEDCIQVAKKLIRDECKVTDRIVIERAHRVGKKRRGMIGRRANQPRPLIVRFMSYADRQLVKKGAKNNLPDGMSCSDDLPYAVRKARQKLAAQFDAAKGDPSVTDLYIAYPARLFVNGELVTSINPATCEPFETRVPQRPHTSHSSSGFERRRRGGDERSDMSDSVRSNPWQRGGRGGGGRGGAGQGGGRFGGGYGGAEQRGGYGGGGRGDVGNPLNRLGRY